MSKPPAAMPLRCRIAPRALGTSRAFVDQLERWTVRLGSVQPREAALFGSLADPARTVRDMLARIERECDRNGWMLDWEGPLQVRARSGEATEVLLVLEGLMDRLRREAEFMVSACRDELDAADVVALEMLAEECAAARGTLDGWRGDAS